MKLKNITLKGLYQSLGLTAYCIFIVLVLNNLSNVFPHTRTDILNLLNGFMVLIIFIISALITGAIALVYPIFLATRNKYKEAGFIVLSTVLWLILFLIITFIILIIFL
jgi:hypothetical protein